MNVVIKQTTPRQTETEDSWDLPLLAMDRVGQTLSSRDLMSAAQVSRAWLLGLETTLRWRRDASYYGLPVDLPQHLRARCLLRATDADRATRQGTYRIAITTPMDIIIFGVQWSPWGDKMGVVSWDRGQSIVQMLDLHSPHNRTFYEVVCGARTTATLSPSLDQAFVSSYRDGEEGDSAAPFDAWAVHLKPTPADQAQRRPLSLAAAQQSASRSGVILCRAVDDSWRAASLRTDTLGHILPFNFAAAPVAVASPDGTYLAVASGSDPRASRSWKVVHAASGDVHVTSSSDSLVDPIWQPHGRSAILLGDGSVELLDPIARIATRHSSARGASYQLVSQSPDGRWMVLTGIGGGEDLVETLRLSAPHRVLNEPGAPICTVNPNWAWSPNSQLLAGLVFEQGDRVARLRVLDAKNLGIWMDHAAGTSNEVTMAWSPDNKKIAAVQWGAGQGTSALESLTIFDVRSGQRLVTVPEVQLLCRQLSWNPDGSLLACRFYKHLIIVQFSCGEKNT